MENSRKVPFAIKKNFIELSEKDKADLIINTEELNHSAPCIGYSIYLKEKRKFQFR